MYCVVQEVELKKPNKYGAYKEISVGSFTFDGKRKYYYGNGTERFERPIKKAYKISIHESKRVNGVVTKKQYAVTTLDYYNLAENSIYDCIMNRKLEAVAIKLNTDIDHLWDLIFTKVEPLQKRIESEFQETEEYKVNARNNEIKWEYQEAKAKFAKLYDCDPSEYDYCYDVFGVLRNEQYWDMIIENYKARRSYHENAYSNYSDYGSGSSYCGISITSSYTDTEKTMLKKFYRVLSKEYHPDNMGGSTEEMQLVNKLKGAWGL